MRTFSLILTISIASSHFMSNSIFHPLLMIRFIIYKCGLKFVVFLPWCCLHAIQLKSQIIHILLFECWIISIRNCVGVYGYVCVPFIWKTWTAKGSSNPWKLVKTRCIWTWYIQTYIYMITMGKAISWKAFSSANIEFRKNVSLKRNYGFSFRSKQHASLFYSIQFRFVLHVIYRCIYCSYWWMWVM